MVTINDVARKAGVSVSTVSRVLRDYPNISAMTKQKVLDAVEELNYVPNAIASALSSKKFDRVAIWVNVNDSRQAIDEINMQYIFGAFSKAQEINMNLFPVFSQMLGEASTSELIRYFKSEGITGIIIYGLNKHNQNLIDLIDKKIFKIVVVDAPNVNENTSSVTVNHYTGQYEVAKKLIKDHKHKELLYLAGKEDGYVTDMRLEGMKRLQQEAKFNMNVQYADFSEKKAREFTFKYGEKSNVIVCASDLMAIGAKNALKEMNIFRPVCGYDGITLMGYDGEGMYTVKQDFKYVSQAAIYEMHQLLNEGIGRSVLLDFEITQLHYEDIIV